MLVLFVDDDDFVRVAISEILRGQGHQALEMSDYDAAIRMLEDGPFDAVIVNAVLHGVSSGVVLASLAATAGTPVLLLAGRRDMVPYLEKGTVPYLVKPVAPDAVLRWLRLTALRPAIQPQSSTYPETRP
ncbi:MAG: response regulator transcription factor [Pirellulaceae bacterium]